MATARRPNDMVGIAGSDVPRREINRRKVNWARSLVAAISLYLGGCVTVTVDTVNIVAADPAGTPTTFQTEISVLNHSNHCEYRLEYITPDDPDWAISEIAGNQGGPQRLAEPSCTPPSFTETNVTNLSRYEEQTIYYWVKEARDYSIAHLWITPPGMPATSPDVATNSVSPDLLTRNSFRDLGCFPDPQDGCMRAWQHEGARLHFLAGTVDVDLIAHEYGHYAAGYVFGHMDIGFLGLDAFDVTNCAKRSFQEAIANTFERLFVHEIQTTATPAAATPVFAGANAFWRNQCGITDERMGRPLWQAFEQALWGTSAGGLTVTWPSSATANDFMANAFTHALSINRGHRIHQLAYAMLDYIENNPDTGHANRYAEILAVFAEHGMAPAALGGACQNNDECESEYCDRGDGTSKTELCMPGANAGIVGDLCTHDNQCESENCEGLVTDGFNNWVPGQCQVKRALSASCSANGQCDSNYCDAGLGTSRTDQCMPAAGDGANGQACSNDNQCTSFNCNGLMRDGAGNWLPGLCDAKLGLGSQCALNQQCDSDYCDTGDGTSRTDQCMPLPLSGVTGDTCSNDNQCASDNCAGLVRDDFGDWTPGQCDVKRGLAVACTANGQCNSGYCDTGDNTSHTNRCMPAASSGAGGDACSNDNQCVSNNCAGLTPNPDGSWNAGVCDTQRPLGQFCLQNPDCQSGYCDRGNGTSHTNQCMPGAGAGTSGDTCSNNNQCASSICLGLTPDEAGSWIPGNCT